MSQKPPKLNKTQKLIAIETYLQWPIETEDNLRDMIDHIWWVVYESKLKPEEQK